mmetsp:Transcript_1390/g.2912  ORF Transcript_1390/g.2912 Transcript_1390/m.2912 type:complete len:81 (+) Transcript_1390:2753-2995(+)
MCYRGDLSRGRSIYGISWRREQGTYDDADHGQASFCKGLLREGIDAYHVLWLQAIESWIFEIFSTEKHYSQSSLRSIMLL